MNPHHPSFPPIPYGSPYNLYIPDAPMSHLHDDMCDSLPPPSSETMAVWPPAPDDDNSSDVHYP